MQRTEVQASGGKKRASQFVPIFQRDSSASPSPSKSIVPGPGQQHADRTAQRSGDSAMMIESRNLMPASSMPRIDVTRLAIFPVSRTFAFTVLLRQGFGVPSRFRLSCCEGRLFGLCCACGHFDCFLRLAIRGSFGESEVW